MANILDKYEGTTEEQRYRIAVVTLLESMATKPAMFSMASEEPVTDIEKEVIVKPKDKRKTTKKEV